MASKNDLRQSLSRRVLASILVDSGAVIPVIDIIGRDSATFPSPDDKVYAAIISCVNEGVAPTVEAVAAKAEAVTLKYVGAIASSWSDEDNRNLIQNTRQLKQYAELQKVKNIGRRLALLDDTDNAIAAVSEATVELSGINATKSDRDPSAVAVSDAVWKAVNEFDANDVIPSGMGWFDKKASGLWGGMMYWIVGAYKSGKSTLMRNMVLSALQYSVPVDVFVAEGSREMFALSMQVMIATKWLYENQPGGKKRYILSPLFVMRLWKDDKVLTANERRAIDYARKVWERMPIRVWDTSDGIRDINTLAWRIRQSRLRYGTRVAAIDYLQLLGSGDTEYQRVSNVSRQLQEIAQSEHVANIVLAQRNENAISGGGNSYSPGVKGGGDPAATADFLFLPRIDKDTAGVMDVRLHLSRWTSNGSGTHFVNPQSGLIIDKYTTNI